MNQQWLREGISTSSAKLKPIHQRIHLHGQILFNLIEHPLKQYKYVSHLRHLDGLVIPGEIGKTLVLEELTRWWLLFSCLISCLSSLLARFCKSNLLFRLLDFSALILMMIPGATQEKRCHALRPIRRVTTRPALSLMLHVGSSYHLHHQFDHHFHHHYRRTRDCRRTKDSPGQGRRGGVLWMQGKF